MRIKSVCKLYPFFYARSSCGNVYFTAGVPPVNDTKALTFNAVMKG